MFHNLIESGSHRTDLARRGRFLLGTFALYSALIACAGVASVYAYNARLDEQLYEVTMLPPWALPQPATAHNTPDRPNPPRRAGGTTSEIAQRVRPVTDLRTVTSNPPPISTVPSNNKPIPQGGLYRIGARDSDPINAGIVGLSNDTPGGSDSTVTSVARPHVVETGGDVHPPEAVKPTPAPTPARLLKLSQIQSSKIISKPVPSYPQIAKLAGIQGTVTVEILVDEQGRVISATATSGPVMLREAARLAALQARFTPTQLNGQPVKVSGAISYNFTLH